MKKDLQKVFLELLCAAMWDREVNTSLFTNFSKPQWNLLPDTALKQSVAAMIADKILSLPPEYLPSQQFLMRQMSIVKQTERMNLKLNKLLNWVRKEYHAIEVPFVVLKGPGTAQNYPNPLLRAVGDLDVFLYKSGDYEKVNEWIIQNGFVYHHDLIRDGHRAFEIDGFIIENHKYITFFERKKYNKLLENYMNEVVSQNSFSTINIGGEDFKILPPEINGCYIFLHLFFHFIHAGVGFRQVCDWLLFLSKNKDVIDKEKFVAIAKSFDLLYPMQLFARASVDHLGADAGIFPFNLPGTNNRCDNIIDDILEGGNFGFHRSEISGSVWAKRFKYFLFLIKRTVKFLPIAPSYTVIVPFAMVINRIKLTFKGH